jgi:hypothetical protein
MSKHTDLPWEVHEHEHINGEFWCSIGHDGWGPITDIIGAEGNKAEYWTTVAGMKYLVAPVEEQRANAELIARACNSHGTLLLALEEVFQRVPYLKGTLTQVEEAIAKAKAPAGGNKLWPSSHSL